MLFYLYIHILHDVTTYSPDKEVAVTCSEETELLTFEQKGKNLNTRIGFKTSLKRLKKHIWY